MIITLCLLFVLIRRQNSVERYIYAVTIWSLICLTMTEALSLFKAINAKNLYLCWLMIALVLFGANVFKGNIKYLTNVKDNLHNIIDNEKNFLWLLFAVVMVGLSIKTVPYNSDSMVYHLPRIYHWAEHSSVEYYATSINRQVASPILADYINMHVYVMSNYSDRLINLLQCFSYLTCGWLVYHIAQKLACSEKYCNMAVVLFYSMPIAFGEALTTQVDNVAALWMLAMCYLMFDLLDMNNRLIFNKETTLRVIVLSLCIGFGYLTKPSVCIGMVFFALWLLCVVIRRKDSGYVVFSYILLAGVILIVLLIPGFWRNMVTYNALSTPGVGQRQLIGTLEPGYVLINCIKNFTFNMPTIWLPNSTQAIYNIVIALAKIVNVDINNPTISEDGNAFGVHGPQTYGHDTAVNPIIVWMLIVCFFLWIVRKKHIKVIEKSDMRVRYFLNAGMSFVIFCAVLRWEVFVSRYMISYLALLCPAIVGIIEIFWKTVKNKKAIILNKIVTGVIYIVCFVEVLGLFVYHGKIAFEESRYAGYFHNRGQVESNYRDIADYVNSREYKNIGLMLDGNSFEYPLLVLLDKYERLEHVNIENDTSKYEDEGFIPDVIISIERMKEEDVLVCHGKEYNLTEVIAEDTFLYELAN